MGHLLGAGRKMISTALLCAVSALLILAYPQSAHAKPSDSLEGALEAGFDAPATAPLTEAGASYGRLLVAERLPRSGGYLVEVGLDYRGETLRWPMKADYANGVWSVTWQPSVTYARALINLISSGQLPKVEAESSWGAQQRLPAFPILVMGPRIITPFGAITAEADARLVEESGDPRQGLSVSPGLVQHSKRWVSEVLEGDPGPATVDLLVDPKISWERMNQAVFSIASVGLYDLSLVTKELGSVAALAPVVSASQGESPPLVVGVYDVPGEATGFRVGLGGEVFPGRGACAPEMSFCASGVDEFNEALGSRVPQASLPPTAMVAAPGEVETGIVLGYLGAIAALRPAVKRVILGYIQM